MSSGEDLELAPLVLKFGGSAFAELAGYQRVVGYAARRQAEEGRALVLVVSAMSGTTGRLRSRAWTRWPPTRPRRPRRCC